MIERLHMYAGILGCRLFVDRIGWYHGRARPQFLHFQSSVVYLVTDAFHYKIPRDRRRSPSRIVLRLRLESFHPSNLQSVYL